MKLAINTNASANASDVKLISHTEYQKYDKSESVVDSAFMNDKYCGPSSDSFVVVATRNKVNSSLD